MKRCKRLLAMFCVAGAIVAVTAPKVLAQGKSAAEPPAAPEGYTFWEIVFSGGPIGISIMVLLILCSVAAVALTIEQWIMLRRDVLVPPKLSDEVRGMLAAGQLASAQTRLRDETSFLGFVLGRGLSEADGGWDAVEKAMEEATAEQSARLMRRVEYLSVLASIAPMLGLLGTVVGMIMAFKQVAETQGAARPGELAEGIYTALVTTVAGLMIAIPALGAFALLRNRLDELVAEAIYAAEHATVPLKRFVRQRGKLAAAPPALPNAASSSAPAGAPVPPPPPSGGRPA